MKMQQMQHQSLINLPPVFGMVVPTLPFRTDFVPVASSNNTKFTLSVTMNNLPSVNELVFFLLPNANTVIPSNHGALIYFAVELSPAVSSGFELLGYLEPNKRYSDIFRSGWSEREEFVTIPPTQNVKINIGISIEPMEVVRNLTQEGSSSMSSVFNATGSGVSSSNHNSNSNKRPVIAYKVAEDLLNFMKSFDTGVTGNQAMTVPVNIFDRWWQRFESKLIRDPNFFLKNNG